VSPQPSGKATSEPAEPDRAPGPARTLRRVQGRGYNLAIVEQGGEAELHLTARSLPGETPAEVGRLCAQILMEHQAVVVRQEIFGPLPACREALQGLQQRLGGPAWPVTCVQGGACGPESLAGLHILAVRGMPVETVSLGGRPVGRTFRDHWARHLLLGDVQPNDGSRSKPDQARQAYEQLEAALGQGGMTMANVARTWLFIDDILSWYGPFNQVRTVFYQERGMFDRLVPASTGVSGVNARGTALVSGAWAVEALNGAFSVSEVASPKQCPAPAYGSSFSRAVELRTPALSRLLVSGTASIEPGGASVCGGDVEAQIDLTMEVVRAILVSREMDFADASRVTAYFKNPQDVRFFQAWRKQQGLGDWPAVHAQADICRDELLFEIELDALRLIKPPA
jgi:enamine deaminase RidA (YjgF/YER057c/UK114 family)